MAKRGQEYWLLCAVALSELQKVDKPSRERLLASIDLPSCSEVIEEAPMSLLPKMLSALLGVAGREHLAELSPRDLCSELLCLVLRIHGCNKATIRDISDLCSELMNELDLIELAYTEFSGILSEMQDDHLPAALFDSEIRLAFFFELLATQFPTDRVWKSIAVRPDGSFRLLNEVHADVPAPLRLQVLKLMAALSEASHEAFDFCRDQLLDALQDNTLIIQEFATRALLDLVYLHARDEDEGLPEYFEGALMEAVLLNGSTPEVSKLIDQFLAAFATSHQDEIGNTIVALVLGEMQKGNLVIVPTAGFKSSRRPAAGSIQGPSCYLDSTLGPPHEVSAFHTKVKALLQLCQSHGIVEVICRSLAINIQSMQQGDEDCGDDGLCGSMDQASPTEVVTEEVCETWLLSVGRQQ
eukprot:jgi/Mesvir1/8762/Mv02680-RA.1